MAQEISGSDVTVTTAYVGPGMGRNKAKGAHIVVKCVRNGKRVQRAYSYDYSAYDPHTAAALLFASDVLMWPTRTKAERLRHSRSARGFVVGLY